MGRLGSRLPFLGSMADFSAVDQDIVFVGPQKITSDAGSKISIVPGAGAIVQIGDASTTNHSLADNDDLYISGKLEVDKEAYFDYPVYMQSWLRLDDDQRAIFGSTSDVNLLWSSAQTTANAFLFCLDDTAKIMILSRSAMRLKNFDHAAQTNPTIFIHSATDPDSANTEWISFAHNVTDGVITTGKGAINLVAATSVINIGATLNMTGESSIATTANGKLHLVPNGTGYVCIGSGTSGQHSLSGNGDAYIEGDCEIDGILYADGGISSLGSVGITIDQVITLGSTNYAQIEFDSAQTSDETLMVWLDSGSCSVIFADRALKGKNFDQSGWSTPTIIIFSSTDPDTLNTEWGAFYHDTVNFNIESGKGDITLTPASGLVSFANCTLGGGTVTHDDYFEMDINGVTKKVMLGS